MCGRYTHLYTWAELVDYYRLIDPNPAAMEITPRYNIAPTQMAPVVRLDQASERRELVAMRWGLIPPWAKDIGAGARLINARAETVAEKPAFRAAFRRRRCLVPASGFYEWQPTAGRAKQPYFIADAGGGPLTFAGLWERWHDGGGTSVESFTIITTEATATLAPIHGRMPVILTAEDLALWLDPDAPAEALLSLLRPASAPLLARPVSRRVNDVRRDDPECLRAPQSRHPTSPQPESPQPESPQPESGQPESGQPESRQLLV